MDALNLATAGHFRVDGSTGDALALATAGHLTGVVAVVVTMIIEHAVQAILSASDAFVRLTGR